MDLPNQNCSRPPIIGVTTYSRSEESQFHVPCAYLDVLRAHGAVPVLLTPGETALEVLFSVLDGLLLSGGGDIEPALYGGSPHHTVYAVDPERDEFELGLARLALQTQLPTLGICRGMQILNVVSEGTLVVHVPEQYGGGLLHRIEQPRQPVEHAVSINAESRLARVFGQTEIQVVSWHHQAVQHLGKQWQAVAAAADGVLEAMEHTQHPWAIAVQWHPEMSAAMPWHQRLFAEFVAAAGT